MPTVKTYRDLKVWQESMNLAAAVYELTQAYPKHELYGLTSQTRRAATSLAANIAEGYGRRSRKEFRRFVTIAGGSLTELETHLLLAQRLNYIDATQISEIWPLAQTVGRLQNGLLRVL